METQVTKVERTNEEWCAAIVNQDAAAWNELNRKLYTASYRLVERELDRLTVAVWQEIASEAVQDAGLNILRRLDQYEGKGAFLSWCYVIVLNATRDRMRRERRRLRRQEEELLEQTPSPQGEFAHRVADQIFLDELADQIYRCVTTELRDNERTVFLALAQAESTPNELAHTLKTTRNNIDQIWYRSRQKVRRTLERAGYTIEALQDHGIL